MGVIGEREGEEQTLVVQGRWTDADAEAFRSGRATDLIVNYARGSEEPDLEFLREGLPIRGLLVVNRQFTDLSPIYELAPTLETLNLVTDIIEFDLSRLPLLRSLGANWAQVKHSIQSASTRLESLHLGVYKPATLNEVSHLTELRELFLWDRPRMRSLDGVQHLPHVTELTVAAGYVLSDISALHAMKQLHFLRLTSCPKITDLEPLAECTGLTYLEVSDCRDIESLEPVRGLTGLTMLNMHGNTRITDGNLDPLKSLVNLEDLRLMNRRHYQPTAKHFTDALGLNFDPKGIL